MKSNRSIENASAELTLALGLLIRRMRKASPSEADDLSWTQKSVVARLDKEGSATTAELARAEGVTPQSMGAAVAALEALGMVERRPHPTDGRQMNIALAAKSAASRKSAKDARRNWLAEAISQLSRQEQATLFEAGEIIKRLVEL